LPSRAAQDAVLRALFDRNAGAGFSVMKTPIGATDFQSASPDWYTYDDVPGDVSMSHFSIARDLKPHGLVTYIRRARQAGGQFVLDDPGARRYIARVPYHGYAWGRYDAVAALHERYAGIPIWMTELCCLHSQAEGLGFASGDGWANAIVSDLEAGASAWIHWN